MSNLQALRLIRTITNAQLSFAREEKHLQQQIEPSREEDAHILILRGIQGHLVEFGIDEN